MPKNDSAPSNGGLKVFLRQNDAFSQGLSDSNSPLYTLKKTIKTAQTNANSLVLSAKNNPNLQKLVSGYEEWENNLRREAKARLGGFKPLQQVFDSNRLLADEWDLLKRVNTSGRSQWSLSAMKRSASETSLTTAGGNHKSGKHRMHTGQEWDLLSALNSTVDEALSSAPGRTSGAGRLPRVASVDASSLAEYAARDEAVAGVLGALGADPLATGAQPQLLLLLGAPFVLFLGRTSFLRCSSPSARGTSAWLRAVFLYRVLAGGTTVVPAALFQFSDGPGQLRACCTGTGCACSLLRTPAALPQAQHLTWRPLRTRCWPIRSRCWRRRRRACSRRRAIASRTCRHWAPCCSRTWRRRAAQAAQRVRWCLGGSRTTPLAAAVPARASWRPGPCCRGT